MEISCLPFLWQETYSTMNNILVQVDYKKYQWEVCGDFKVIAVLLGLQAGYTKYSCFLCEWESGDKPPTIQGIIGPHRKSLTPGMKIVIHKPLIKPSKVLPSPLHIKLGLMKNFCKCFGCEGSCIHVLTWKIPQAHLRESKNRCVYWSSNRTTF